MNTPCTRCGGSGLEPGSLGRLRTTFIPDNRKFFTLSAPDVPIRATMCLDCGLLELFGDLNKAESLLRRPEPR